MVSPRFSSLLLSGLCAQVIPILDRLPAGVQKLMFSATLNDGVKKIASSLLINPVTLTVGEVCVDLP